MTILTKCSKSRVNKPWKIVLQMLNIFVFFHSLFITHTRSWNMSLSVLWKYLCTAVLCIGPILNRRSPLVVFTLGKNKTVKLSVFQQGTLCFRYYYSKRLFLFLMWMNSNNSQDDKLRTSTHMHMSCVLRTSSSEVHRKADKPNIDWRLSNSRFNSINIDTFRTQ